MSDPKKPEDQGTPTDPTKTGQGGNGEDPKTPKTFSEEEHQAELDRVAAKTRDEEKAKREKAIADAKAEAKREALEEAKMSEAEREKKNKEKQDKEAEERNRNITLRENRATARDKFAEVLPGVKVDDKLIEIVTTTDEAETVSNVENVKNILDVMVEKAVEDKMKGNPPKDPHLNGGDDGKKNPDFKTSL
jgi:hypothetical protein